MQSAKHRNAENASGRDSRMLPARSRSCGPSEGPLMLPRHGQGFPFTVLATNILPVSKSGQTHSRLQQQALDLFSEHGFQATTVEQIARAAGVSEMTFFRHFPTKDAVVLDDPFDPQIAAAVAAQPGSLAPLTRACRGLRQAIGELALPDQHQVRQRVRIVGQTPSLAGGVWANTDCHPGSLDQRPSPACRQNRCSGGRRRGDGGPHRGAPRLGLPRRRADAGGSAATRARRAGRTSRREVSLDDQRAVRAHVPRRGQALPRPDRT